MLTPTQHGEIQAVLRIVPLNNRSVYVQMTKSWPTAWFDEAIDMAPTYGVRPYHAEIIQLLKELRTERAEDERMARATTNLAAPAQEPTDPSSRGPRWRLLYHAARGKRLIDNSDMDTPQRYEAWYNAGRRLIEELFGPESGELDSFAFTFSPVADIHLQVQRALRNLIATLESLAEFAVDDVPAVAGEPPGVWAGMHQEVVRVAQGKFESGHEADAVRAAVVEIVSRVKAAYRKRTGKEDDGASLMFRMFGGDPPPVSFGPRSNASERDYHDGHRTMLVGIVEGLRNPFSHENKAMPANEALELLHFCSYLNRVLDRALPSSTAPS